MPFSEDFREIDKKFEAKPTQEYVDVFSKAIQKLKFKFSPEDFKNPSIEKMWSEIEAIALDRDQPDEVIDSTLPDKERIQNRAGIFLNEFSQLIGLDASSSSSNKRKVIFVYFSFKYLVRVICCRKSIYLSRSDSLNLIKSTMRLF